VDQIHTCIFVLTKCAWSSYFTYHPSHGTTLWFHLDGHGFCHASVTSKTSEQVAYVTVATEYCAM